ncbi:MAG TPA: hypothetical protein VL098_03245 [Flavipsychrobacter sp.]|nr:hypothetical protein [Flavipsychrobacter sp.]
MRYLLILFATLNLLNCSCNKEPKSSQNPTGNDTNTHHSTDTVSAHYTLLDSSYTLSGYYVDSNGQFQTFSNKTSFPLQGTVHLLQVTAAATDTIFVFGETFVPYDTGGSYITRNLRRFGDVGFLYFRGDTLRFDALHLMQTMQESFSINSLKQ